jgi:hypothetical protein
MRVAALYAARLRRFVRNEDGNMVVFGVLLSLTMMMIGGLSIDLMRQEKARTAIQQTLDRGVLAAASLNQPLDPIDVLTDYFAKAGLDGLLNTTDVQTEQDGITGVDLTSDYRLVTAMAGTTVPPLFVQLIGQGGLIANASATAEQKKSDVEISLVLDVSGSMAEAPSSGSITKLENLKIAAKDFVTAMMVNIGPDRVSINLIPYNGQVNLGPDAFAAFSTTDTHGKPEAFCIDLPAAQYTTKDGTTNLVTTTINMATSYPQAAFADTYAWADTINPDANLYTNTKEDMPPPYQDADGYYSGMFCQPEQETYVEAFSNDEAALHARIDALIPVGHTSIDVGMKWGVGLLDPSTQGLTTSLIGAGKVSAEMSGRPHAYDAADVLKAVVLMTDGENQPSDTVNARSGLSPIYGGTYTETSGGVTRTLQGMSLHWPTRSQPAKYWMPHLGGWRVTLAEGLTGATQLTWPQVWERARMKWVAWQLFGRPNLVDGRTMQGRYAWYMNQFRTTVSKANMNIRLDNLCDAAKAKGILVYSVAFEADDDGKAQLQSCASSIAHYFDASGLEIESAFSSIASNIIRLRLTQ